MISPAAIVAVAVAAVVGAVATVAEPARAQTLEIQSGSATVFAADPDPGFYVDRWTGPCANNVGDVANPVAEPDGEPKTCALSSPSVDAVGVVILPVPTRPVNFSQSPNGTVVATVAGVGVESPFLVSVHLPVAATFTAVPDAGYYVSLWTGACESIGTTGEDDPSGTPQTCAVAEPAGTVAIATGATFASVRDCGNDNRKPGTTATTCGDCLETHADADDGPGYDCRLRVTCDPGTEEQTNPYTCDCKSGFNDLDTPGTCVENTVCANQFREQTNDATCGNCLDTHAPDESDVCQERVTCDDENKVQMNPYTCEPGCKTGFNELETAGTCVANVVCSGENIVQKTDAECACADGHYDPDGGDPDGTGLNCVPKRITLADLQSACSRGSEPFGPLTELSPGAGLPHVGSYCYFVPNPNLPDRDCFVLNDGVVIQAGTRLRGEGHLNGVSDFGGYPAGLCDAVYPACDSDIGEVNIDGHLLSGCHVTDASCGGIVSGGIANDDGSACECDPASHEGTFPVCTAITGTRTVSVSISDNGVVVATVGGTIVAEGGSADFPGLAAVTFIATPTVGYYVSAWTGDCDGPGDVGVDGVTTTETCVLNPGTADVEAGATFTGITDNQRITAAEVAEDCAAAGGHLHGVNNDGTLSPHNTQGGTYYAFPGGFESNHPINVCFIGGRDGRCYSVRPGFVPIPADATLYSYYNDEASIPLSATCDNRYPDCAAQGKTERIPGNELSGCVDSP